MTAENTRKAIQKAYSAHLGLTMGWADDAASGIEANPSALLDAMTADGMARAVVWCPVHRWEVLNERHGTDRCTHDDQHIIRYEVIHSEPPHVHEWQVTGMTTGVGVRIRCTAMRGKQPCTERGDVSAILPIEIPSDR